MIATLLSHRIEALPEKKLIGKKIKMSYANNLTHQLWSSFIPRRKEIKNVDSNLFSLQIYHPNFFKKFDPAAEFEKWALVEVDDFTMIPEGMEAFTLKGGLYVVFDYKGDRKTADETFQYIFSQWLPHSGFELDDRPHFEILGEKYKRDSPDSEEEIWIPVKKKS
jgi:AraC family transcriptional regulator